MAKLFRAFNSKTDKILRKVGQAAEVIEHIAKTADKKAGSVETILFYETEAGLIQMLKAYGILVKSLSTKGGIYKELVNERNRQVKTDDKNDLRTPKSKRRKLAGLLSGKKGEVAQREAEQLVDKWDK